MQTTGTPVRVPLAKSGAPGTPRYSPPVSRCSTPPRADGPSHPARVQFLHACPVTKSRRLGPRSKVLSTIRVGEIAWLYEQTTERTGSYADGTPVLRGRVSPSTEHDSRWITLSVPPVMLVLTERAALGVVWEIETVVDVVAGGQAERAAARSGVALEAGMVLPRCSHRKLRQIEAPQKRTLGRGPTALASIVCSTAPDDDPLHLSGFP